MTTDVPEGPLAGRNDVIVGATWGVKIVKLDALAVSAPPVFTVIVPVVAPAGTTAVALVVVGAVQVTAAVPPPPLNVTPVTPVKPVPVMFTVVPITPHTGVNVVTAATA
jgi:hypothetical protein